MNYMIPPLLSEEQAVEKMIREALRVLKPPPKLSTANSAAIRCRIDRDAGSGAVDLRVSSTPRSTPAESPAAIGSATSASSG